MKSYARDHDNKNYLICTGHNFYFSLSVNGIKASATYSVIPSIACVLYKKKIIFFSKIKCGLQFKLRSGSVNTGKI